LRQLRARDISVVLLGVGGGNYTDETQRNVRSILREIKPAGMITRDEDAYDCYSDLVGQSYSGIDCALFIDEWHSPVEANTQFDVATFDKIDEPTLRSENRIVRTDHHPFDEPHKGLPKQISTARKQRDFFDLKNILVSDNLEDYLFLYANAETTHSDRIHACIPTLVYGNEAQFWFETPRAALFDRVLDEDITSRPVSIDREALNEEKEAQARALAGMISDAV